MDEHRPNTAYFYHRLKDLGLSPADAPKYGLSCDRYGNIPITARTFNGQDVTYQTERQARQLARVTDRKTTYQPHAESLETVYQLIRHAPEYLEARPGLPKYLMPKGVQVPPLPAPNAIQAYQSGKTGGTVYFIEGYFKAVAMDAQGLEAVAFSGNTLYKVCPAIAAYLEARRPDHIVILYDADADRIKPKPGQPIDRTRIAGFENSAHRFAGQLFTLFDQVGHKARIYFAMVRPDSPEKGIDDVLTAAADPAAVIADLEAFDKAERYFQTFRLPKDPAKRKKLIRRNLGGEMYRDFYRKFADQIGREPFRHEGIIYQTADGSPDRLRMITDPFAVPIERTRYTVKTHLSDITTEIDAALSENPALAISAPTGSGKTTYFIKLAKRTGQRVVIVVPTVGQVRQLIRRGVVGICGRFNQAAAERAVNSPVIVCTYDTLHHVTDLFRRTLVIDEAHNLINQYGQVRYMRKEFRAGTLRRLLEFTREARRTVYISGTMPETLCLALNLPLIEVHRQEGPTVIVRPIEAEKNSKRYLIAATVAQLRKQDFSDGFTRVVFYNDKEAADLIREQMRDQLAADGKEISIISRDHYDNGENAVYDHITSRERLPENVGLLVCTCILSEGVNINNKNIGRLYTVGLRNISAFRQFVARFRNIAQLEAFDIRGPEKDPKPDFSMLAATELEYKVKLAELQAETYHKNRETNRQEYTDAEAEYLEDIERGKRYQQSPEMVTHIYADPDTGKARPDVLRILAEIEQRKEDTGTNAYYYTQLEAAPEITVIEANAADVDQDTADAVNIAEDARKAAEREALERTRAALIENPGPVISALREYYQQKNNRHGGPEIDQLAPDLIEQTADAEAFAYLEEHRHDIETKNVRQLIRDYCRLHFIEIDQAAKAAYLETYNRTTFARHWKIIVRQMERAVWSREHYRKGLNDLQRFEIAARLFLADRIEERGQTEYTADQLAAAVADAFTRTRYVNSDYDSPIRETLIQLTPGKAAQLIRELFNLEEQRTQTGKAYRILQKFDFENIGFLHNSEVPIFRKPSKILAFWRGTT